MIVIYLYTHFIEGKIFLYAYVNLIKTNQLPLS